MKTPLKIQSRTASVLVGTLFLAAVLVTFAGSALYYASNKRIAINQAGTWEEALLVAEDGVHNAISKVTGSTALLDSGSSAPYSLPVTRSIRGAGGSWTVSGTANYKITGYSTSGVPFYKVRSIGTLPIAGSKSMSMDSADMALRKINLTGKQVANRTVEVWIAPISTTDSAVTTNNGITINNGKLVIDAFDSTRKDRSNPSATGTYTYPSGSTDPNAVLYGQPPTSSGQFTQQMDPPIYDAALATNSQLIVASDATVYGDASTNGGTVSGATNVMGDVRTDYYKTLEPVSAPVWPGVPVGINPVVTTVKIRGVVTSSTTYTTTISGSTTLTGGLESSHAQYIVNAIDLKGANGVLNFDFGTGSGSSGHVNTNYSYVDIYVIGDVSTKGMGQLDGSINIAPGVHVNMWIGGNMSLGGNGISNGSAAAPYLSIYGVNPPDGTTQTFDFGGNSTFYGSVYAPGATLTDSGSSTFVGSMVGDTATFKGDTTFYYDAALAGKGKLLGFKQKYWFEDTGPTRNQL